MNGQDPGLPVEQFIQALTSQLDRVQSSLALKARAGLPLTFAVKDLTLDLRTHVEMTGSVVFMRPAAPGETDTSVLHLTLTTITRPMIEENTLTLAARPNEPTLKDVLGSEMSEDEQRRLEWIGVQSVDQLQQLQHLPDDLIGRVAAIPAARLRMALQRAAQPHISSVVPELHPDLPDGPPLLRIHGANLLRDETPIVHISGVPAQVVEAHRNALLVAPDFVPPAPEIQVKTAPYLEARKEFDIAHLIRPVGLPQ